MMILVMLVCQTSLHNANKCALDYRHVRICDAPPAEKGAISIVCAVYAMSPSKCLRPLVVSINARGGVGLGFGPSLGEISVSLCACVHEMPCLAGGEALFGLFRHFKFEN